MDFGRLLSDGWKIIEKDIVQFVIATLVWSLVASCTVGILGPVTYAGFLMMIVNKKRNPESVIAVGDLFKYMNLLIPLLIMGIVIGLIVGIGTVLCIIPGLIFAAWWIYVPFLMVDKGMSMGEAMSASKTKVTEKGMWNYVLLLIIASAIMSAGSLVAIGYLITIPIGCAMLACAYEEDFGSV